MQKLSFPGCYGDRLPLKTRREHAPQARNIRPTETLALQMSNLRKHDRRTDFHHDGNLNRSLDCDHLLLHVLTTSYILFFGDSVKALDVAVPDCALR